MTTNERCAGQDGPVALDGVQVCVTDTGVRDANETFTGGEFALLGDGVVVLDDELTTDGRDDSGGLDGGDAGHCSGVVVVGGRLLSVVVVLLLEYGC